MFKDRSIEDYLKLLASKEHIPGGGTTAAINSASACSLILMAINFTIGKEEYDIYLDHLTEIKILSEDLLETFIDLIDKDSEAYNNVMSSYKIPKNEEVRSDKIQEAYKQSLEVPFTVFGLTYDYFTKILQVIEFTNKNLLTDVYIAFTQIKASLYSSRINILINAKYIKDKDYVLRKTSNLDQILKNFEVRYDQVINKLEETIGI